MSNGAGPDFDPWAHGRQLNTLEVLIAVVFIGGLFAWWWLR